MGPITVETTLGIGTEGLSDPEEIPDSARGWGAGGDAHGPRC